MPDAVFLSHARNGEDVVLWRALRDVAQGRYVEVGASLPPEPSVTRAFSDAGWSGVTVEPTVPRLDDALDEHLRPDDPIHLLVVDAEVLAPSLVAGLDLRRWRPWVLVVGWADPPGAEPGPGAWEADVLAAGYRPCLFDGLSRFYVADEHADLAPALSYPACPRDAYETAAERDAREERRDLLDEVLRWRALALDGWARRDVPAEDDEAQRLRAELEAMRATISWRLTAPLRSVRSRARG